MKPLKEDSNGSLSFDEVFEKCIQHPPTPYQSLRQILSDILYQLEVKDFSILPAKRGGSRIVEFYVFPNSLSLFEDTVLHKQFKYMGRKVFFGVLDTTHGKYYANFTRYNYGK